MSNKKVLYEIDQLVPPISQIEESPPPEIELAIAARQRQILRNTAVQLRIQIKLAEKRHAGAELKELNPALDKYLRDIGELDGLFPGAKKQMDEFDTKAISEGRL